MANPAPHYLKEEVITVIDGKRIESYSPGFVRVVDIAQHGEDAVTGPMTSIVRPVSDFPGNAEVEAYIKTSEKAREDWLLYIDELKRNKRGLKAS